MPVNQERKGPNLAAIPHAPRERLGNLAAINERETRAAEWRKMGERTASFMADGRPFYWGEMSSSTSHSKAAEKASRASKEAKATKRAKKNR